MTSIVRAKKSKRVSLASAASQSNSILVQELLNEGENVNGHDDDGFTALHRACAIGDDAVVQVLLTNKADPNIPDSCGDTSLHWACFCGHVSTVTLLLDNGANPNIPSSDGKTALGAARDEGHTGIVRALKNYLDKDKTGNDDGTPGSPKDQSGSSSSLSSKSLKVLDHQAGKIIPGMDFIVEIEGGLKKKSKNTLLGTTMWRTRYFMLSEHFCGLFLWLGADKTPIDKDVKFFPYELFYKCGRSENNSKVTKRFNLSLTNGRHFCLQAESSEKCAEWIHVLNKCGGRNMAVLRVQQCWRHYHARRAFQRAIDRSREIKNQGVLLIKNQRRGSMDTSITRGPLKKKDYHGSSQMTKLWRNRYFVVDHKKGELRYYDNRTKEKIGYRPRTVKFEELISINYHKKRAGGRQFTVRVTNGRTYELSAEKRLLAQQWVSSLMQLLPAENVAALKVQQHWRGKVAWNKWHKIIVERLQKKRDELKASKEEETRLRKLAAANEQATARRNRLKRLKIVKDENSAAKAASDAQKKPGEKKEESKMSRIRRLKAAKAAKAAKAEETRLAREAAEIAKAEAEAKTKALLEEQAKEAEAEEEKTTSPWQEYVTDDGTKYYHNSETGETRWDKPEELMTPEERLAAANLAAQRAAALDEEDAFDSDGEDGDDEDPNENWKNWTIVIDVASGREYYVNSVTNETRWVCPTCMLQEGWDSNKDAEGRVYYYNKETSETSWDPPYREECDPLLQPGKPYSEQETYVFTIMISQLLEYPMDVGEDPNVLYELTKSGLVLGRLINIIEPDTLDERALNGIKIDANEEDLDDDATTSNATIEELSAIVLKQDKAVENFELCMNCFNLLGIPVSTKQVNPTHLAMGDPHCVNELCYLLLRHHSQSTLDPNKNKHVFALCEDYEDRDEIGRVRMMTGTQILNLWVEKMTKGGKRMKFAATGGASDAKGEEELSENDDDPSKWLIDSEATRLIVEEVAKSQYGEEYGETLENTLASQGVCNWFYEASHLSEGRIMEIVVSLMFANKSTLVLPEVEQAEMVEDDPSLDREMRTYKTWITSLLHDIEGSKNIRDLVEDLRDGELLIKIIALITGASAVQKGKVGKMATTSSGGEEKKSSSSSSSSSVNIDWKRVNKNTSSRFKRVENINYLLELCQQIGLNLTNIGALDILDRNPKILNALLYRLLRFHSLLIVTKATGGEAGALKDVDEKVVVKWVNEKIASSEEGSSVMRSFRDPENKNSVLFMELLEAMRVCFFFFFFLLLFFFSFSVIYYIFFLTLILLLRLLSLALFLLLSHTPHTQMRSPVLSTGKSCEALKPKRISCTMQNMSCLLREKWVLPSSLRGKILLK